MSPPWIQGGDICPPLPVGVFFFYYETLLREIKICKSELKCRKTHRVCYPRWNLRNSEIHYHF